ncbi:hypothetical protein CVD28_00990 [Bacillus sp. M6-12]|uniref:hypothetical protein n=1 Tax=Bacillus sp. M6-12 TaxID=2054166 RepID=UPI000C7788F0|nr:hypothetical protein [Bacillus sp. M6-12]PLS19009.1 hypothetical protein CVD28_00990 [Bacillus sp. M6-12]
MATHWHYPDVLPLEDFSSLIEESALELQKAQLFLTKCMKEPMLLFKEAHIYLKSNRNIVTAVMTTSYMKHDKVNPHAFQVYLASILDKAIQEWVQEKEIPYDVRVLVRNPNSFPSIFAVYVNEQEVLQFNIFDKWYGTRDIIFTEEDIRNRESKTKTINEESLKEIDQELKKWTKIKEKPTSLIRTPTDIFVLLFKRKKLNNSLDKKVSSLQRQKEDLLKDMRREEESIPAQIEHFQKKQDYTECLIPFFKELSYSLEDEKYNLY